MALRVARGLFRLWAVLSALWVGAVGVATWSELPLDDWISVASTTQNLPDAPWAAPAASPDASRAKPPFDPSKPYEVVAPAETKGPPPSPPGFIIDKPSGRTLVPVDHDPFANAPAASTPKPTGMFDDLVRRAMIIRGVEIGLIPPAFVLVIGSAFVWAFRGFRN